MTAINREYELTYGPPEPRPPMSRVDFLREAVRPRPVVCWMLAAVMKARNEHFLYFGDAPHTVYLSADDHFRLMHEITMYGDMVAFVPGHELRVLGMRVEVA